MFDKLKNSYSVEVYITPSKISVIDFLVHAMRNSLYQLFTFSKWSEYHLHRVRGVLLIVWLMLLFSLIWPRLLPLPLGLPNDSPLCWGLLNCRGHGGNRIFWGILVPTTLLLLVVSSHELWRRVCPLAFVSQLFRALGLQRTVTGHRGSRHLARVEPRSWLARNHIALQWGLLIISLALRLLAANSDRLALALLIIFYLVAAMVVGWAWSGKAWCQYFCPIGPVQTLITGPRALFGSSAHLGGDSRVTQSMCRTVGVDNQEKSVCVGCQSPCIDIDAERAYWYHLRNNLQLSWAWFSYPGLVLTFFLLLRDQSPLNNEALTRGLWALERDLPARFLAPWPGEVALMPRLLAIPLLLLLGAFLSERLFRALQAVFCLRLRRTFRQEQAKDLAAHRTRLLATFCAVNLFFAFRDPSLGLASGWVGRAIYSAVLIVSSLWLIRGWRRNFDAYMRERQILRTVNGLLPPDQHRS